MSPEFVPHPLVRGGHRQTVLGAYLWRTLPYRAEKTFVSLPDGDRIVLHDDLPDDWSEQDGAAILVHGLAGCYGSGYMQRIAAKLVEERVRVFRMDMRGCGAGAMMAQYSTHAGRTEDLAAVVTAVRQRVTTAKLAFAGFSLGASILLKWLGDLGSEGPRWVDQAVAVAAPLDLSACSRHLRGPVNRLYDYSFVRRLQNSIRERQTSGLSLPHADLTTQPRNLYEFDALYTAKMGGFPNVEEYYRRSSCAPLLHHIDVPTFVLHANDDPLIPTAVYERARFSETTEVHRTRFGGHLGYLATQRSPDQDWFWMDWRVVEHICRGLKGS